MEWKTLLTKQRLGKDIPEKEEEEEARTCFQRDYDRIVFSSPFRRLQDKTQVYSLAENDYVRTRLTHSIEVSCVGRSLGTIVGLKILEQHQELQENYSAFDFGSIVSAACLAHDIGNPPFGHSGEFAISDGFKKWYENNENRLHLTDWQKTDFEKFEGNAQGFRILTRLEMPKCNGGMQLTYPTLAAFTKYPKASNVTENDIQEDYKNLSKLIKKNKHGFFSSEIEHFQKIAETLGLISIGSDKYKCAWGRHPLAYLVEAADDICYQIVDFEDGHRMGLISYEQARDCLCQIRKEDETKEDIERKIEEKTDGEEDAIKYLRAVAINNLVHEAANIFSTNEGKILEGKFESDLLSLSQYKETLDKIKKITIQQVFDSPSIIKIEITGYEMVERLTCKLLEATFNIDNGEYPKKIDKLFKLFPERYRPKPEEDDYQKILKITDYISGMTDSYATSMFKIVEGISL